jgi:hypothetical protein
MFKEGKASFSEEKAAKRLFLFSVSGFGIAAATITRSGANVFWCFFSKKNRFLLA